MTTRLSQRKIKGGDPAYPSLKDELDARSHQGAGGGGYVFPIGGIPRSDLTQDIRTSLALAESAYIFPAQGIPTEDLDSNVRSAITKAQNAYQKPSTGIVLADLEKTIQDRLTDFNNFYVYPSTRIPYVDLDSNVQGLLNKADMAYQKPEFGITKADLAQTIQDMLDKANTAYQKPEAGISVSDLAEKVTLPADLVPVKEHIANADLHITDHENLTNVGRYKHEEIDLSLDDHQALISEVRRELENARDSFMSLGGRFDAMLGRNSLYKIDTTEEWNLGTLTGLGVNEEGKVTFDFDRENVILDVFDISENDSLLNDKIIGKLGFTTETSVHPGSGPWLPSASQYNNVGIRLKSYIYAPKTGTYTFTTQFSGRMRLMVAGKLIIDLASAYSTSDAYVSSGAVELEGGRLYPIVLEAKYISTADKILSLMWQPPGQSVSTYIPLEYMNMSGYTTTEGVYESHVIDLKDDSINLWYLEVGATEYLADDEIIPSIATSTDGITFTDWESFEFNEEIPATPRRFVKFRLVMKKDFAEYTPLLDYMQIRYISSTNNEMRAEILAARDSFTNIGERLSSIDNEIKQLSSLGDSIQDSGIHPEQFASIRLLEIELNLLQFLLREAEGKPDYTLLEDGFVDTFKTGNFIDSLLSDPYEIVDQSVAQMKSLTRLEKNEEWSKWTSENIDYIADQFRLAAVYGGVDPSRTTNFSNWYLWSTREAARLAGNYQDHIAQPFYTGQDISSLTRLRLQVYDSSGYVYSQVMIVESSPDGTKPNLNAVLFSNYLGYVTGAVNLTGLRIPVTPLTKYWIIIKRMSYSSASHYTRWYQSANNTSTNIRLRGSNPKGASLYMLYSSNGGTTWLTDTSYFLSFEIDETIAFAPEGRATRILDYHKPQVFVSTAYDVAEVSDGVFSLTFQSSEDQNIWSSEQADLAKVPPNRFLKVNLLMKKSTTGFGSPLLNRLDIYTRAVDAEIISKSFSLDYAPTHFLLVTHESEKEALTYYVSRDDGGKWLECKTNEYVRLDSLPVGKTVRVKARVDTEKPIARLYDWACIAIRYRDVTGQNITALYEEQEAKEGQKTFTTMDRFPTGNNALQVFLNGVRQSVFKDYIEVDEHTVEFTEPLIGGLDADRVTFYVATGAYDVHDASITARIEDTEVLLQEETHSFSKQHTYDEQDRISKTVYLGLPHYSADSYTYYDDGKKHTETITRGEREKVIEYIYDDQKRIVEEKITINEVTV